MTTTEGFRYLSVKITPELSEIIPANYEPKVIGVTETLNRWSNLPISMVGQINLIKMTILPTFLYYFQTLPLPNMFYDNIKQFGRFIWNDKQARLYLKLLHPPYERASLQLPNLGWYYMAAQLTSASNYFCTTAPPTWVSVEQEPIQDLPINLYLYSSDIKKVLLITFIFRSF